jgi:tRNA C32,U32 (ribose-2'-O)-methylase TrmJ
MSTVRELEESIHHIRKELADGEPLSAADRQQLDQTLAEIERILDENDEQDSLADPLYDELRSLSGRIEKSQPSLSVLIGRIVDALGQIGI